MKTLLNIVTSKNLSATFDSEIVELGDCGRVSFAALITDAAGSSMAPSSAPVGAWTLWFSHDRVEFFPIPTIESTDVAAAMGRMNATGNSVIRAGAAIPKPPGKYILARYTRDSGGGPGANCELWIEVER